MAKTTKTTPESKAQEDLLGKNVVVTITLQKATIDSEYAQVLQKEASKVTLKGFRQGKAPLALPEGYLGHEKLMEHDLSQLLPHVYQEKIINITIIPLI